MTTEDHEIYDGEGEELAAEADEKTKEDEEEGLSESVHTDYGLDFSEGVSLDPEEEEEEEGNVAAEDTLDDSKEEEASAGNEEDAFDDMAKADEERTYNGDENLNEDCDDDVDDAECINDDHLERGEDGGAEGGGGEGGQGGGDEHHAEDEGGQGDEPGASCDNSA